MKTRDRLWLFVATLILAAGCYSLASTATVYSTVTTWTGTGRGTFFTGRAVGLSGQRMITVDGTQVIDDPLASHFGGQPYVLHGYTQTDTNAYHQVGVLLAHRTSESGSRDLFVQNGLPRASGWERSSPTRDWFLEYPVDAVSWTIVEICDVAAVSELNAEVHRIFVSVRARRCGSGCNPFLNAAVVELEIDMMSYPPTWSTVRDAYHLGNAAVHDQNGAAFSDECMPIDTTTTYGDQVGQRLVVADPSADTILLYDVASLRSGPVDVIRTPDSTRSPADVTIMGDRDGAANYAFVVALWRGSSSQAAQLRHYDGTLSNLDANPHLVESLTSDVRFVQAPLQGVTTTTPESRGDLYTFGSRVSRRRYEY